MNKIENIRDMIIEFFLLLSLGGTFNDCLSDTLNEISIFDYFGLTLLGLGFLFMVGVIIYQAITKRNRGKLYYVFITFLITGFCLYTVINYSKIKKVDSSLVVMKFSHISDLASSHLELRQDSTYLFIQNNFMGTEFSRGKYSKNDSIIKLNYVVAGSIIKSETLLIRKGLAKETILYQVEKNDNQYKVIEKTLPFMLTTLE
ncbi:hypothetical protein WAF17_19545 [Bernardetia sp. ABR2-2B]|uniref:hypothetical protein n=1 Tax=Bernardetia sp. ABR2-2B TaxID=3127472 RepID=UPI0030D03BBF